MVARVPVSEMGWDRRWWLGNEPTTVTSARAGAILIYAGRRTASILKSAAAREKTRNERTCQGEDEFPAIQDGEHPLFSRSSSSTPAAHAPSTRRAKSAELLHFYRVNPADGLGYRLVPPRRKRGKLPQLKRVRAFVSLYPCPIFVERGKTRWITSGVGLIGRWRLCTPTPFISFMFLWIFLVIGVFTFC